MWQWMSKMVGMAEIWQKCVLGTENTRKRSKVGPSCDKWPKTRGICYKMYGGSAEARKCTIEVDNRGIGCSW
jgi:hypothetical protein